MICVIQYGTRLADLFCARKTAKPVGRHNRLHPSQLSRLRGLWRCTMRYNSSRNPFCPDGGQKPLHPRRIPIPAGRLRCAIPVLRSRIPIPPRVSRHPCLYLISRGRLPTASIKYLTTVPCTCNLLYQRQAWPVITQLVIAGERS